MKHSLVVFCCSAMLFSFSSCDKDSTGSSDKRDVTDSNTTPWSATGLSGKLIQDISVSKSRIYVTVLNDSLYRSTDLGSTWKALNRRCYNSLVASYDSSVLLTYPSLYHSKNFGDSWTDLTPKFFEIVLKVSVNCSAFLNTIMIIGMEEDGIFISTDNGNSFTASSSGLESKAIYKLMVQGNIIYAGALAVTANGVKKSGGVFVSSNNGVQWTATALSSDSISIQCLAGSDKVILAGTMDQRVFISTNKGINWTNVSSGLNNHYIYSIAVYGEIIFAASGEGDVFISNDNGITWKTFSSGLPKTEINSLALNGDTLYAGTASGVWKRVLR